MPEASPSTTSGVVVDSARTIGTGVGHRVGDQGRRPPLVGRAGQGGLVEVGDQGDVGPRGAVGDRVG